MIHVLWFNVARTLVLTACLVLLWVVLCQWLLDLTGEICLLMSWAVTHLSLFYGAVYRWPWWHFDE